MVSFIFHVMCHVFLLQSSLIYRLRLSSKVSANTSHPWMSGYSLQVVRSISPVLTFLIGLINRMWPQKCCETSRSMMETLTITLLGPIYHMKGLQSYYKNENREREREKVHISHSQPRHETCEWTISRCSSHSQLLAKCNCVSNSRQLYLCTDALFLQPGTNCVLLSQQTIIDFLKPH